ncbi:MAG: 50S ribosomal protein L3 [Microgenomates group bacterium]|nr:50S ribosomal protein L3 [Microgenomates group bacterium]
MSGFILGQKIDQRQGYNSQGDRIVLSFIKTSPCYLVEIKKPELNGYFSAVVGFGQIKNIKKPILGKINKAGIKTPLRFLKEFRLDKFSDEIKLIEEKGKQGLQFGEQKIFVGEEIKPTLIFKKGERINVVGKSKGKGFQGVVKRHRFAGGPRTHGQSDRERAPGSIGQTTTPGRVYRGKRMAGRMGQSQVMIKNLEIFDMKEDGFSVVGLLPGAKGDLLKIYTNDYAKSKSKK